MPKYSKLQIAIHWMVVAMVTSQWLTSGAIARTHDPLLPVSQWDLFLHKIHNYCGVAIGALILLRVLLRLRQRIHLPHLADMAAAAVHWGLYASLAAQAATGVVAAYFWLPAAGVHKLLWNVTLALVTLHIAAALWHGVRRDGVLGRMLPGRIG